MTWTVRDVMSQPAVTVTPTTSFKKCVDIMRIQGVSGMPVIRDDGGVAGVITEADLLARLQQNGAGAPPTAADVMTREVVTVDASASVGAAARLMLERHVKRLPVVDGAGRVVGVVSRGDLLRVFLRSDESIRKEIANGLLNELPLLGRGRVQVEVADGVVRLDGEVESGALTGLLLRLVAAVPGVVGVENHMRPAATSTAQEPAAVSAR
ncbi:MAG TPA: CBS domain-containing protein [Candidatus Dormibacteraeota bacterium]|nr:CBS domain-containing protein [Candidatus Dormibacteraeota bacterium]